MNEGPGIPKGSGNVRMLAYLASIENDQSSERAEYVGCVACVLTWRVFYFLKVLGRTSIETLKRKARHPIFRAGGGGDLGTRFWCGRKENVKYGKGQQS